MRGQQLTYARAGVSIDRGDRLVDMISPAAKKTLRPEVVASIGGFAALARLPRKYRKPLLVTSTDGVGTKVLVARSYGKVEGVGIDLVAMSVNDILTIGAEPLLFLDYYATARLDLAVARKVIEGIAKGCRQARCALVGGETAEMPKLYRAGDFDLAGFCVGVVEEGKEIDGRRVRKGDILLGLPSTGPHSNGYSLIRKILERKRIPLSRRIRSLGRKPLGELLLAPTRIYVREILRLMEKVEVKAMAHITGGGIDGNLPRVLPRGVRARVDPRAWKVPPLFRFLQEAGNVSEKEMFRTFNMGIGYIVVVGKKDASKALKLLPGARAIGEIV